MIGVIGDAHFKLSMGYADYIEDGREAEKQEVLDKIVDSFEDCDTVVFLGDNLDKKNNASPVLKEFTEFVERFKDKEVYLLAGNHEKRAGGGSAIDYLQQIEDRNWTVVTDEILEENGLVFCPFFFKPELGVDNNEEGREKLVDMLPEGDILFHHHAVSDTQTESGKETNIFPEVVLPKTRMEQKYNLVVGGHIHKPKVYGNTVVSGSVFTDKVGEEEKFVYKVDRSGEVEQIPLPVRPIRKLTNPSTEDLAEQGQGKIIKAVMTEEIPGEELEELKNKGEEFCDGFVLVEQYPHERERREYEGDKDIMDLSVDELLAEYAQQNDVDKKQLSYGFDLIQ